MITLKDKWKLGNIYFVRMFGFDRIFKIKCTTTEILFRHSVDKELMESMKKDKNLSFYNENKLKSYLIIDNKDFLVNNCVSSNVGEMQVLIGKDWIFKYNKTNK